GHVERPGRVARVRRLAEWRQSMNPARRIARLFIADFPVAVSVDRTPGSDLEDLKGALLEWHVRAESSQALNADRLIIAAIGGPRDGLPVLRQHVAHPEPGSPRLEIVQVPGRGPVAKDRGRPVDPFGGGHEIVDFPPAVLGRHAVEPEPEVDREAVADGPLVVEERSPRVGRADGEEW